MKTRVLGSAAGGGFPQWNCRCHNCDGVRRGSIKATPRTQSSIAIRGDSPAWLLVNASPDILTQIRSWPESITSGPIRSSAIAAVLLVDGQLDHTAGLFMLREGDLLQIYCTATVRQELTDPLPILRVLQSYCRVQYHEISIGEEFDIPKVDGLQFRALDAGGVAPPYSRGRTNPGRGENIALVAESAAGRRLVYAPGIACMDAAIVRELSAADCVLIDGSFWTDDELIRMGIGTKRAADMGHLALSGDNLMVAQLTNISGPRKILIHINNTNPILDENSVERRALASAGIEVAHDGMEIDL